MAKRLQAPDAPASAVITTAVLTELGSPKAETKTRPCEAVAETGPQSPKDCRHQMLQLAP